MSSTKWQAAAVARAAEGLVLATRLESEGKLEAARNALTETEYDTQSDDFPGTQRWLANSRVLTALAAFDAAHPEIIVAILARPLSESTGSDELDR